MTQPSELTRPVHYYKHEAYEEKVNAQKNKTHDKKGPDSPGRLDEL